MSGEVVTFATAFFRSTRTDSSWVARGPFEVSASRYSVVVHHASCASELDIECLVFALREAAKAMRRMSGRYGMDSLYPTPDGPRTLDREMGEP